MEAPYLTNAHESAAAPTHAPQTNGGDADEMQTMWQFLDSTLSTPNGVAPSPSIPQHASSLAASSSSTARPLMPAAMAEPPLTEDENGMYNELGDVFNMFVTLDFDENQAQQQQQQQQPQPQGDGRVQLSRHASAGSSFGDGISPGMGVGYPSMSPATLNWLQSLSKSPSSESLSGLISPATMSFTGSAGGLGGMDTASGSGSAQGGLPRSPSCEMIDWKAYNDAVGIAEKTQKEQPKWRVIPQHGPHADGAAVSGSAPNYQSSAPAKPPPGSTESSSRGLFTRPFQSIKSTVGALVGALSPSDASASQYVQQIPPQQVSTAMHPTTIPQVVLPSEITQQYELAAQRMAEEKNKRKAIISPEYVQYGSSTSAPVASSPHVDSIKHESMTYATEVPDPTGRRPSKKSLHHTGEEHVHESHVSSLSSVKEEPSGGMVPGGPVRCKCTGKCRNARCACVKAGFVCGVHCKCVGCANPFVPMEKAGINILKMVDDVCLMQFLSKVKDMEELLDSAVTYDCCGGSVQVKETVENGFTCPKCSAHYTYSWCSNRLCHDQKKPRKHCAKCRRCGDHRNEHCDDCNHCYFAGVANSFSCSCKAGKNGYGPSSGSGVKSRSIVPNHNSMSGDEARSPTARDKKRSVARGDENANPQTAPPPGGMAAGLSSSDAEKDDACPMQ